MDQLTRTFGARIAECEVRLSAVGESAAIREVRPGGWRGKEVLGHLIDSALNNHQRFVRAALDGAYVGPAYDQRGWVNLHGYADLPWKTLCDHWREQNALLARVVERIPETRLNAVCRVADNEPVTLGCLIEDYLRHLRHHIAQLEALKGGA